MSVDDRKSTSGYTDAGLVATSTEETRRNLLRMKRSRDDNLKSVLDLEETIFRTGSRSLEGVLLVWDPEVERQRSFANTTWSIKKTNPKPI